MKKISKVLALLLAVLLLCSVTAFAAEDPLPKGAVLLTNSKRIDASKVKLIAYRGLSACAPENTLAAITLAGRCGCDGVSLDIQPTLDGEWICFAGHTVSRMTNGTGVVSAMTAAQLDELRITGGNGVDAYPNEKIPTLRQAITVANLYNMKVVLTINNGSNEDLQFIINKIDTLMATLRLLGVAQTATIISAEDSVLTAVKNAGGRPALNTLLPLLAVNTCLQNGYVGFSAPISDPVSIMNAAANNLEVYGTNITTLTEAEVCYGIGMTTLVSSSLVKHAPIAENAAASIFSKVSTELRTFLNKIVAFFQELLKNFAIDQLLASFGLAR